MKLFRCISGLLALCLIFCSMLYSPAVAASEVRPPLAVEVVPEVYFTVVSNETKITFPVKYLSINDVDYKVHDRFLQYEKQK